MRTAVGHPDYKDLVEDCGDRHIPQKDDLCGYKRWQAGAKGCGRAYSPKCVEKLFGNSQARARRLTISLIIAAYTNASALAHSLS